MRGFTLIEFLVALRILAMESYYAVKETYTSSVSDLIAVGFRQTPGVTLVITLPDPDSYSMTASNAYGSKPSYSYNSNDGVIQ